MAEILKGAPVAAAITAQMQKDVETLKEQGI
jgi:hypothetical protein